MSEVLADRPRSDPAEDRLGYAPFAKMLATSVLRGCPADGLVIGIYGTWGLGKSTLLNFIEHEVAQDPDEDAPVVVRFNPWWFSGREDLIRRFFKEFELAVLKKGARNKAIVEAAQKLGEAAGSVPVSMVATLGKTMAGIAKLAQPGDIAALKKGLADALTKDAFRVLVLIDDIDRLLPDDMLEVFRLVKAVGDFPNVIYVLAFDREASTRVLREKFGEFGARYLEKIVQVQFDLPMPRPDALRALFSERLERLFSEVPPDLLDEQRLGALYRDGIEPLLRTPRDAVRLLNAVSVTLPAVIRDVNPVDFLGLETLRLHFPSVYAIVRREASHFVGMHAAIGRVTGGRGEGREHAFHEEWLADQGPARSSVEALVNLLFPGVLPGSSDRGIDEPTLRRARRVCTEEHFEKYFQYGLASDELSRDHFMRIIGLETEEATCQAVALLTSSGSRPWLRFREFLETLRDHLFTQAALARPTHLVRALCLVGDKVIEASRQHEPFVLSDDYLLSFVIEDLLKRLPETERLNVLCSALEPAGVSTVVRVMATIAAQHGRMESQPVAESERVLREPGDIDALQAFALERIRAAAQCAALWDAPWLVRILFAWRLLGQETEMREWVARNTTDDARLVRLLGMLLEPTPSRRTMVSLQPIGELFDIATMATRLERVLQKPEWSERDASVLALLLKTLRAAARGPASGDDDVK